MDDFRLYSEALRVESGRLVWKIKPSARTEKGSYAGTVNHDGYLRIGFKRKMVFAHRVVWLLTHGEWPQGEIDHINGDRQDNRPENLRIVSRQANMQNRRAASKASKTGLLGVRKTSSKSGAWYASIRIDGEEKYLGVASTPEQAHEIYVKAKRMHHAGCTL